MKTVQSDTAICAQLVLCIPGPWEGREAFVRSVILGTQGQYRVVDGMLQHVATRCLFELQLGPRDVRVRDAFGAAGRHWDDASAMSRIATHRSVVYLLGHGGSDRNVQALMLAARALLDAGGFGVKVESSGVAHPPGDWRELCATFYLFSPFKAFVLVATDPGEACSCGMHAFGLHDVRVFDDDDASALFVAQRFSWNLFALRPVVRAGQTFACDDDAPVYRIHADDGADYTPGSLFINPFGTWRLQRA